MGAIVSAVKEACESVVTEALDTYEQRARSELNEAVVRQIRNDITDRWWGILHGVSSATTKASHDYDGPNFERGSNSLYIYLSSWSDPGMFHPVGNTLDAYVARNSNRDPDSVKPGALLPPSTFGGSELYIFRLIFDEGQLGLPATLPFWYHKNAASVPNAHFHHGIPLGWYLTQPANWKQLQNILDRIVA